jgi:hypothetical protein
MDYPPDNDLTYPERNILALSSIRNSAHIGIVPIRFATPAGAAVNVACAIMLIDIYDYSKAGFLVLNESLSYPDHNIHSIFHLLIALGYETYYCKIATPAEWFPYDPQETANDSYVERLNAKARKIGSLLAGEDGVYDVVYDPSSTSKTLFADEIFPGIPENVLEEILVAEAAHELYIKSKIQQRAGATSGFSGYSGAEAYGGLLGKQGSLASQHIIDPSTANAHRVTTIKPADNSLSSLAGFTAQGLEPLSWTDKGYFDRINKLDSEKQL